MGIVFLYSVVALLLSMAVARWLMTGITWPLQWKSGLSFVLLIPLAYIMWYASLLLLEMFAPRLVSNIRLFTMPSFESHIVGLKKPQILTHAPAVFEQPVLNLGAQCQVTSVNLDIKTNKQYEHDSQTIGDGGIRDAYNIRCDTYDEVLLVEKYKPQVHVEYWQGETKLHFPSMVDIKNWRADWYEGKTEDVFRSINETTPLLGTKIILIAGDWNKNIYVYDRANGEAKMVALPLERMGLSLLHADPDHVGDTQYCAVKRLDKEVVALWCETDSLDFPLKDTIMAVGRFVNGMSHLMLFTPDRPEGVFVLSTSLRMGRVNDVVLSDGVLFLKTVDDRDGHEWKVSYWSSQLPEVFDHKAN